MYDWEMEEITKSILDRISTIGTVLDVKDNTICSTIYDAHTVISLFYSIPHYVIVDIDVDNDYANKDVSVLLEIVDVVSHTPLSVIVPRHNIPLEGVNRHGYHTMYMEDDDNYVEIWKEE
jgi:hypothetical protein